MIKTQELISQIEQLTRQHDDVLTELTQMKQKLNVIEQNTDQKQYPPSHPIFVQIPQPQLDSQTQHENLPSKSPNLQPNPTNATPNQQAIEPKQSMQVKELAKELLNIKETVGKLEQKTRQFVNDQSQNQFAEKDVVHLVMIVIQAMTDWASEYLQNSSNQNE